MIRHLWTSGALMAAILFLAAGCRQKAVNTEEEVGLPDTILKINRLIDDKPNDASLYDTRAKLYIEYKDPRSALADAEKAIALEPKEPDYYVTRGDVFFSLGKVHDAISSLKQARSVSSTHIPSLLKLGEIYFFLKDYKTSILYLDSAAKLDDTNPDPYLMSGFALAEAGDTANAIRYFNETLKRDKNNYRANIHLGVIYTHKLNPIAVEYYQNALNIKPESAEAFYNLGKFYQDMGKFNEAIDAYLAVTRLKDDMGFRDNAFYGLGYIHIELKVYDTARDYFGQAIQANPAYYQAYYAKGYAHERLGDLMNAKAYYDKALEINPGYETAREARDQVVRLINSPM
ncbi:MAG TPA: tetratricopeptide repeat protein [Bacteroidales bacterium]|nr:tetratricopeptide repeat protein [Bacteroidales bacterium]HRZ48102.1 tetratricopeptide repeat protein [Bacteroidales bacterium]